MSDCGRHWIQVTGLGQRLFVLSGSGFSRHIASRCAAGSGADTALAAGPVSLRRNVIHARHANSTAAPPAITARGARSDPGENQAAYTRLASEPYEQSSCLPRAPRLLNPK